MFWVVGRSICLRFWSDEEEELLRVLWVNEDVGKEELMRVFNRSWHSLDHKRRELGLDSWTCYRGGGLDRKFLGVLGERLDLPDRVLGSGDGEDSE